MTNGRKRFSCLVRVTLQGYIKNCNLIIFDCPAGTGRPENNIFAPVRVFSVEIPDKNQVIKFRTSGK